MGDSWVCWRREPTVVILQGTGAAGKGFISEGAYGVPEAESAADFCIKRATG